MTCLGIVVGLAAEGRIARRMGAVAVGGGLPAGAEAAARRLVAEGARALLSFGLAGGLDPALRPGDLVVPAQVFDGIAYATDAALVSVPPSGRLLAGSRIAVTAAEKAALFRVTGAGSIDLESGAVARVATEHGLAFAWCARSAIRRNATCRPAPSSLWTTAAPSGCCDCWASVLRQPAQIGGLISLGRDAARARRSLLRYAATASV